MNLINLNLLSSTVTTNTAETLWQLQNNEISTSLELVSLGFVTEQEIQNTANNNNKKQRRNLDAGTFQPRVIIALRAYLIFWLLVWVLIQGGHLFKTGCLLIFDHFQLLIFWQ